MAASKLLPASLLRACFRSPSEVPGTWHQAGQGALSTQKQRLHVGARDAGQCRCTHHWNHRQATMANHLALRGPSSGRLRSVEPGSRWLGRDRQQAGPQRHRLHRHGAAQRARAVCHAGQGNPEAIQSLPERPPEQARADTRSGLRHIPCPPQWHRGTAPQCAGHDGLVSHRAGLHPRAG